VDPLHKTLLIIDEAHKLYGGGDLSTLERPDMKALHESLMRSYEVSGDESVRLLLMTATPITNDPMELIKLVNLCKPRSEQLPDNFDEFAGRYLNKDGYFTKEGEHRYMNDIAGHISYLNRGNDPRQFSQPIIKHISVNLANNDELKLLNNYDKKIVYDSFKTNSGKLKKEIEQLSKDVELNKKVTDRTRYEYLKDKCSDKSFGLEEGKHVKKCAVLASKKISELVREAKDDHKYLKAQVKDLKQEVKELTSEKADEIARITDNVESNEEEAEKIKKTLFHQIRSKCGKKYDKEADIDKELINHPGFKAMTDLLNAEYAKVQVQSNKIQEATKAHSLKIKQIRKTLNKKSNEADKQNVNSLVKDLNEKFKETREEMKGELSNIRESIKDRVKTLKKERKEIKKSIKTNIRSYLTSEKKLNKKRQSIIDNENKRLKRIGLLRDLLNDERSKNYFNKYEEILKEEVLEHVNQDKEKQEAKESAKQAKKEAKEAEKQAKKEAKEAAKKSKKN